MAKEEIIEKLNTALSEEISNEAQVIYIFSRIRKILELQSEKGKYKFLNFYCNWALHPLIDRTEPVEDVLKEFINGKDDNKFLFFGHLYDDLSRFIKDRGLSEKIFDKENYVRFANLLVDIYSETPVIVKTTELRTIILEKPSKRLKEIEGITFEVGYRIE